MNLKTYVAYNVFVRNLTKKQLTPWSIALLQKVIVPNLVKKFPAFYGTHSFITLFTRACHWSLSQAR